MAKEYKVTLWIKNAKKRNIQRDAVYVTTESMERAKKIALANRPGWNIWDVKLSGR